MKRHDSDTPNANTDDDTIQTTTTIVTMAANDDDLERIWALLEQGHGHHNSQEYWEAAECYQEAQEKLAVLSKAPVHENKSHTNDKEEAWKIARLYRLQANEYHHKARESFVEALAKFTAVEKEATNLKDDEFTAPPLLSTEKSESADDDKIRDRLRLFIQLFADEQALEEFHRVTTGKQPNNIPAQSSEFSLEQRLAQLNQNLPKSLQSSEQRMQEINKGLNRLGLPSVYDVSHSHVSNNCGVNFNFPVPNKSDAEQVDDIIAQARDEVALLGAITTAELGETALSSSDDAPAKPIIANSVFHRPTMIDSGDSVDDISSSSDGQGQVELSPQQIESIRDKVATAQQELAQLLVLLESDEGGDAEIEFDPAAGKHALKQARRLLCESAKEWDVPQEATRDK
jgi:hypothetical protein